MTYFRLQGMCGIRAVPIHWFILKVETADIVAYSVNKIDTFVSYKNIFKDATYS